jgi:hypothetical protein
MTFGANSKIFRAAIADILGAGAQNFAGDVINAALFNDTTTPAQDAALASIAYNSGVWVTANEVSQAGQWQAGGLALSGKSIDAGTANTVFLDAADTASGAAATLTNVFGVLVYDNTIAGKYGLCYNSFGGAQSVTAGTFTIVWSASGILRLTL